MTAEIIPFSSHRMTESSAVQFEMPTRDQLRSRAWCNFYEAERRDGASPELARERAEYFIKRRFEGLIDDITQIMAESR